MLPLHFSTKVENQNKVFRVRNLIFSLQTLVEGNKEVSPTLLPYSSDLAHVE